MVDSTHTDCPAHHLVEHCDLYRNDCPDALGSSASAIYVFPGDAAGEGTAQLSRGLRRWKLTVALAKVPRTDFDCSGDTSTVTIGAVKMLHAAAR